MDYSTGSHFFIKTRIVVEESIEKSFLWGYFDGSDVGVLRTCGTGGLIFFSDEHWVKFKVGLRIGTNNFFELNGLKFLLILALYFHLNKL